MLNLMGNAVKFTNKGRIEIIIDWIPDRMDVKTRDYEPIPFNELGGTVVGDDGESIF